MNPEQHLDRILKDWQFDSDALCVRLVKCSDGRDVIQMRVDLGILQLETVGRPDGTRPGEFPTLLDQLLRREVQEPEMELDEDTCVEIDREFVQFYHRRVAWLRMQRFDLAVKDASHTLALMDFCKDHSPCEEWTFQHEQHRAFVLFHRSQASAFQSIEEKEPQQAIRHIDEGLGQIEENFREMGWEEHFESDELVERLQQLRQSLRDDFAIEKTLEERLAEAVEQEQYELAAQLRDEMQNSSRTR